MNNKRQTTVMLPTELFMRISQMANQERRSFNQQITVLLELQVGKVDDAGNQASKLALTHRSETGRS